MIRGIFSNLEFTVGYHTFAGFIGDQLFPIVREASKVLDGAAAYRSFFLINGLKEEKIGRQYWTVNGYAPERKIFFTS